jgi:hypothetical protein
MKVTSLCSIGIVHEDGYKSAEIYGTDGVILFKTARKITSYEAIYLATEWMRENASVLISRNCDASH